MFKDKLREWRGDGGLRDLAERAGVTFSYLAQLEKGTYAPGIGVIECLARALGKSYEEIAVECDNTTITIQKELNEIIRELYKKAIKRGVSLAKYLSDEKMEVVKLNNTEVKGNRALREFTNKIAEIKLIPKKVSKKPQEFPDMMKKYFK